MYWNMWNIQGCYRGYASSAGGRRRLQEIEGFLCSKHIEEEGSKSYKIFAKFTHVFCYLCFSSAPYHVASKLHCPVRDSARLWSWHSFSLKGNVI